jgi:hypothetical protein
MTLADMSVHYENAIACLPENEVRDDCTASPTLSVPVTNSKEIEVFVVRYRSLPE